MSFDHPDRVCDECGVGFDDPRAKRCAHCGDKVSDELFMLRLGCGVIAVVSIVAMGVASLISVLMGGK